MAAGLRFSPTFTLNSNFKPTFLIRSIKSGWKQWTLPSSPSKRTVNASLVAAACFKHSGGSVCKRIFSLWTVHSLNSLPFILHAFVHNLVLKSFLVTERHASAEDVSYDCWTLIEYHQFFLIAIFLQCLLNIWLLRWAQDHGVFLLLLHCPWSNGFCFIKVFKLKLIHMSHIRFQNCRLQCYQMVINGYMVKAW